MSLGQVLSNPLTYPFWGMGLGGLGLLSQASRDLNGKNYGVRTGDAALGTSQAPASTNLGVTLAFANVAQGLPPAAQDACPANLTADALRPYFSSAFEFQASLSEAERERRSESALEKLKSSKGCFFAAEDSGEKWIYQAHPLENGARTLRLQSYRVRPDVGAQLVADEDLVLQLSSDAGLGRKYVADNERGSIAIWLSSVEEGAGLRAHLAHRFPSGSYAGGQAQVPGRCVF
jgi:hypothetical protein